MVRHVLEACAPWLAVLLVSVAVLRLLVALSGARFRLQALATLHRDQAGAVQSLSFVLTLPVFVMILMLIVQVSQVMIATMVVHYAAFAAARSAIVWIPAATDFIDEGPNRISSYAPDGAAGIEGDGPQYTISPGGPKYEMIRRAAVLACLPIAPSRATGYEVDPASSDTLLALQETYRRLVPTADHNPRIADRLRNKLAYSLANTRTVVSFLHPESEPPLADYDIPADVDEFHYNQLGWQDLIRVTVTHDLALLPGPGRLLARSTSPSGSDSVSPSLERRGPVYVRSLTASVTLGIEGEIPVLRFRQNMR